MMKYIGIFVVLYASIITLHAQATNNSYTYSQWFDAIPKKKYDLHVTVAGIAGHGFFAIFRKKNTNELAICLYDSNKQSQDGCSVDFVTEDQSEVSFNPKIIKSISSSTFSVIDKKKYKSVSDFGMLLVPPIPVYKGKHVFIQIGLPQNTTVMFDLAQWKL